MLGVVPQPHTEQQTLLQSCGIFSLSFKLYSAAARQTLLLCSYIPALFGLSAVYLYRAFHVYIVCTSAPPQLRGLHVHLMPSFWLLLCNRIGQLSQPFAASPANRLKQLNRVSFMVAELETKPKEFRKECSASSASYPHVSFRFWE